MDASRLQREAVFVRLARTLTTKEAYVHILSTAWIVPGKTERLREWYRELETRKDESLETLQNEGVRREAAFILETEHGDLLAVFIEVDNMDEANAAFFSSPYELDRQHRAVMDECTVGGSEGRKYAELQYVLENPLGRVTPA